jgi:hypothetical protein
MIDLHLSETGDLGVDPNGDIALTTSSKEQVREQCLLRLATELGDFTCYPNIGADLQRLVGMPNSPATAQLGVKLINRSLVFDSLISRGGISVNATPTAPDTITFKVSIPYGDRTTLNLTLEQLLTV